MTNIYVCLTCRVAVVATALAVSTAACSKSPAAQARGRDDAAKPIKIERVRQENVRRSVEVVGTLAAVDEVTISSEAEGRVNKLLADLGDRVHAGQVLIELDREKPEYNVDQQKAALARALAKFGAPALDFSAEDFQAPDTVLQLGIEPSRIDILTGISGVEFAEAWKNRVGIVVDDLEISVLSRADLLKNKLAVGRDKDQGDIAWLKKNLGGDA